MKMLNWMKSIQNSEAALRSMVPLCFLAAAILMPTAAFAERIAAVVNDRVVSFYDVNQRTLIFIRGSKLTDSTQLRQRLASQVMRKLVDETLQLEEAERRNVTVSDNEISSAFEQIERQARIAPGTLETFISAQGIDFNIFREKTRAEVTWSKLVNVRLRPQVQISDDEVQENLELLKANAGKPEFLLSEIFIQVDEPSQRPRIAQQVLRLREQISSPQDFANAAQQFSSGSTAAQGGDIGWVQSGQMDPVIDQALPSLIENIPSDPILSTDGVYLIMLRDQRKIMGSNPLQTLVTLKQIILPLSSENVAAQKDRAKQITAERSGCANLQPIATEYGVQNHGDLGELRYKDLPENIRAKLSATKVGEFAEAILQEDQILILAVCSRKEPASQLPSEKSVRDRLTGFRLSRLADRYLRELRQAAIVEFRK
jgi:peptidyl-prolyl cis-trans isomerase SurA